jgi:MFS family permease
MAAQAALLGGSAVWFTLSVVAVVDLTGRERYAGVFLAVFNLCVAASAILVGRLMDRSGRRIGLVLGHVLIGAGGAVGGLAVWTEHAWALFMAAVIFGAGLAGALLGRVAAADMYPTERRGRVVGVVVSAGTAGAIGGAPLVALIDAVASESLAWVTIPIFAALGVMAALALRPDPKDLAVNEQGAAPAAAARPLGELLQIPALRAAVAAIVVAQTAMAAVMGVTPVALDDYGVGAVGIAIVISVHIGGMYALGPFIGAALDRFGRRPGLLAGCGVSAAGAVVGSFSEQTVLVGVGMFLVGLGWALCYLGATSVVSDLTTPDERGGALGASDLFTSVAAAAGALGSGFVLEFSGLALVGIVMAALMVPVLLLVLPLREASPGRWAAPVADEPA